MDRFIDPFDSRGYATAPEWDYINDNLLMYTLPVPASTMSGHTVPPLGLFGETRQPADLSTDPIALSGGSPWGGDIYRIRNGQTEWTEWDLSPYAGLFQHVSQTFTFAAIARVNREFSGTGKVFICGIEFYLPLAPNLPKIQFMGDESGGSDRLGFGMQNDSGALWRYTFAGTGLADARYIWWALMITNYHNVGFRFRFMDASGSHENEVWVNHVENEKQTQDLTVGLNTAMLSFRDLKVTDAYGGEVGGLLLVDGEWSWEDFRRWSCDPFAWAQPHRYHGVHIPPACLSTEIALEATTEVEVETAPATNVEVEVEQAVEAEIEIEPAVSSEIEITPTVSTEIELCEE